MGGWMGHMGAAPMDHASTACLGPRGPQALAGAPGPVPCPAAASPLGHPSTAPARCVAPVPSGELPSLCSLSLLFPTMEARAAWDVVLNLNAASP